MTLHVVDPNERKAIPQGTRLSGRNPNHQRSCKTWTVRDRHAIQIPSWVDLSFTKAPAQRMNHRLKVRTGSELRYYTAKGQMQLPLSDDRR
jgi:hypothetical protein